MKILVLPDDKYLIQSSDAPIVGRTYNLEDASGKTGNQNRGLHALILEYWKSGLHPKYGGDDFSSFRDKLKRDLGGGFESFIYVDIVDDKAMIFQVKTFDEIPEHVRTDPEIGDLTRGRLRSVSTYTKKMVMRFIDNVKNDGTAAGVNSKKWFDIIDGMGND